MDDTRVTRSTGRDDESERLSTEDQNSHPSAATLQQIRSTAAARIGDVLALLMILPRYRYVYLHDLEWLVLTPLVHNQFALVNGTVKGGDEPHLVGGVIWARVSPEVDKAIRDQIQAAVFPIRLKPNEWRSGDIVWLLDVLAPTRPLATKILSEIRRTGLGGAKTLNAHPIVQQLVDADLLHKMGARADAPDQNKSPVDRDTI
ncbi:MAG: toxin-activating lysine-acyltransferase [Candidatus Competibacteraceae bacterium]|nr:toxin-activating lysine-acyltransferase [Candidatus Competibacteraceae bacterium]